MSAIIKKERNSNLELYRIISMILIVSHHYVVNSGLRSEILSDPTSINSIYLSVFGMWGKTGINCFMLITGYFMCTSQITVRKFLKLIFEIEFYKIVVYAIFVLTGYGELSLKSLILNLFPVLSVDNGFTSCFLLFYLLIPFLNILISNLDKTMHGRLVLLTLFIYCILYTIPKISVTYNYVTWFSILFFIASYIRKYGLLSNFSNKFWGWATMWSVLVSIVSVICISTAFNGKFADKMYWFVADSSAFLAVVTSICSFMFFKNLNIGHSKVINTIAASTFGVLLIHANSDWMRQWLWKDTLDTVGHFDSPYMYSILCVLGIYVICTILDYLRIRLIETPLFNKLDDRFFCK